MSKNKTDFKSIERLKGSDIFIREQTEIPLKARYRKVPTYWTVLGERERGGLAESPGISLNLLPIANIRYAPRGVYECSLVIALLLLTCYEL